MHLNIISISYRTIRRWQFIDLVAREHWIATILRNRDESFLKYKSSCCFETGLLAHVVDLPKCIIVWLEEVG